MSGVKIIASDDRHRLWAALRLGLGAGAWSDSCGTVGVERDGQILAATVYNRFHRYPETGCATCEVSIAALPGVLWCSKRVIAAFLAYPFDCLGVSVLQARAAKKNMVSRQFMERIGFRRGGMARRGFDGREWMVFYDMLPHEAERWLGYEPTLWKEEQGNG